MMATATPWCADLDSLRLGPSQLRPVTCSRTPRATALISMPVATAHRALRASVSQSLGEHFEAGVVYSTGDALALVKAVEAAGASSFASEVQCRRAQMAAAKPLPRSGSKTEVVASYGWLERGSLTAVDPSGLADLGVAPYLGVEIRQPLPAVSFLPGAHIEAVADLRNITGEGYASSTARRQRRRPPRAHPDLPQLLGRILRPILGRL